MPTEEISTEQRILDAAEHEFVENGFAGARTVAIAERAGVTHAMLHYYFRTKEQLFSRIVDAKLTDIVDSCLSIFTDTSLPLSERIEKGMSAHFDFVREHPGLPRFILSEVNHLDRDIFDKFSPKVMETLNILKKDLGDDIKPFNLILDVVSQNIFPFFIIPILSKNLSVDAETENAFLESVKQENIKIIKKRLGI